jgi:hypothetical protein
MKSSSEGNVKIRVHYFFDRTICGLTEIKEVKKLFTQGASKVFPESINIAIVKDHFPPRKISILGF